MDWKKSLPMLVSSGIVAAGFIISAFIFSNALLDRPMVGNLSGTLVSANSSTPDLMNTASLLQYLGIYPDTAQESAMQTKLENNISNGVWPGFPYVKINNRMYFSKQAVDEWFFEQGKQALVIN